MVPVRSAAGGIPRHGPVHVQMYVWPDKEVTAAVPGCTAGLAAVAVACRNLPRGSVAGGTRAQMWLTLSSRMREDNMHQGHLRTCTLG